MPVYRQYSRHAGVIFSPNLRSRSARLRSRTPILSSEPLLILKFYAESELRECARSRMCGRKIALCTCRVNSTTLERSFTRLAWRCSSFFSRGGSSSDRSLGIFTRLIPSSCPVREAQHPRCIEFTTHNQFPESRAKTWLGRNGQTAERSVFSVAAGRIVCGNQNQLRAGRFRPARAPEAREYCQNCDVGGSDSEADRGEDRETEDEGHKNRIHDSTNPFGFSLT
jgi:hypothetical protein